MKSGTAGVRRPQRFQHDLYSAGPGAVKGRIRFLSLVFAVVRPRDREGMLAEVERSEREPEAFGRFVLEVADGDEWRRAGP